MPGIKESAERCVFTHVSLDPHTPARGLARLHSRNRNSELLCTASTPLTEYKASRTVMDSLAHSNFSLSRIKQGFRLLRLPQNSVILLTKLHQDVVMTFAPDSNTVRILKIGLFAA